MRLALLIGMLAIPPGLAGSREAAQAPDPTESSEWKELTQAVAEGDLPRAQQLAAAHPDLFGMAITRQTLLLHAAREGHPELVAWLLEMLASPQLPINGVPPLAAALELPPWLTKERARLFPNAAEQTARAAQALRADASPDILTKSPAPLRDFSLEDFKGFFAPMPPEFMERKGRVVELLLRTQTGGSPVEALGFKPEFALGMALWNGFGADTINLLLRSGATPNPSRPLFGQPPLNVAVATGNAGAAAVLIARGARLEEIVVFPNQSASTQGMRLGSGGATPLIYAAQVDRIELVELLLAHGAKLETANRVHARPLHFAAAGGRTGIVRLLLDRGASIDPVDRWLSTPLGHAALAGHLEAVKLLVERGARLESADEAGFTPLLSAIEYDHLETVRYLLERGADRRARTDFGKGPLRVAATTNALRVAKFLLDLGEPVDSEPGASLTPLIEAVSSGHPDMTALLLERGASCEKRDGKVRATPLTWAVLSRPGNRDKWIDSSPPKTSYAQVESNGRNFLEIIRRLAAHGADANATDRNGNTALHFAANLGDREVVELLLELGARGDLRNDAQLTPDELAQRSGHGAICDLLRASPRPRP